MDALGPESERGCGRIRGKSVSVSSDAVLVLRISFLSLLRLPSSSGNRIVEAVGHL